MRSNGPVEPSSRSARRNATRSATPCRSALRRATASASGLMSVATTRARGNSRASATARHPEPVPTSATAHAAFRSPSRAKAVSTSSSDSGRGTSTAGVTSRSSPQNSRRPTMRATGSRRPRRATSASNRSSNPAGAGSRHRARYFARSQPSAWRASTSASNAASRASMPASTSRRAASDTRSTSVMATAQACAAPASRMSYRKLRNCCSLRLASRTMPPIVYALTGLCLGIVRIRLPSVITTCLPCRATRKPAFSRRVPHPGFTPGIFGIAQTATSISRVVAR